MSNTNIGNRIKELRIELGLKQGQFANIVGISQGSLSEIESDKTNPSAETISSIYGNYPQYGHWLMTGEGPKYREEKKELPTYNDKDYLEIPFYDVTACAGGGALVDSERITDYFAFKSHWVKWIMGLDPKKLALIFTVGDSMEPTLREGELILVDLRETTVIEDAIYIIQLDGRLFAKRLQRLYDGTILIKSDNSFYEKQSVKKEEAENINVVGRAVWVGRRV